MTPVWSFYQGTRACMTLAAGNCRKTRSTTAVRRTAGHHDALVSHQPARAILAEQRHLRALHFSIRNSLNFANVYEQRQRQTSAVLSQAPARAACLCREAKACLGRHKLCFLSAQQPCTCARPAPEVPHRQRDLCGAWGAPGPPPPAPAPAGPRQTAPSGSAAPCRATDPRQRVLSSGLHCASAHRSQALRCRRAQGAGTLASRHGLHRARLYVSVVLGFLCGSTTASASSCFSASAPHLHSFSSLIC